MSKESKGKVSDKNDVLDMFNQGAQDIGLDDSSSSIIIANLNATTLPMCVGTPIEEIETDDVTLVFFMLDESPSMRPVEQEVINGFNEILIPGLRGGSNKVISTIEVGGIAFCGKVRPLWNGGFAKLSDLSNLTKNDYDTNRGYATALNQAVLDGMTAVSVRSAEIMQGIGIPPKVMLVALSDGANNCDPLDPTDVKKVADALSEEIFVKAFAGFETGEHVDFKKVAKEIGFGKPFEMKMKRDESKEEMGRRFRHLLGVMSSSIVGQSQTKVTGTSNNTFWQS